MLQAMQILKLASRLDAVNVKTTRNELISGFKLSSDYVQFMIDSTGSDLVRSVWISIQSTLANGIWLSPKRAGRLRFVSHIDISSVTPSF